MGDEKLKAYDDSPSKSIRGFIGRILIKDLPNHRCTVYPHRQ